MKPSPQTPEGQFALVRIIQFALLVAAPVVYLLVAYLVGESAVARGDFGSFVLYLLLIVATAQPAVCPIIEKVQLANYRTKRMTTKSAARLYVTISVARMAFVEAIYIYGLVAFMLSNQLVNMLYFYPVGIAWTIVYWSRRDRFDRFVRVTGIT